MTNRLILAISVRHRGFLLFFLLSFGALANSFLESGAFKKLIDEQKYAVALDLLSQEIKSGGTAAGGDVNFALLLIEEAKLKMGLHGYETAVKDLKARTWPKDPMAQNLLHLYYAHTLRTYHQHYSWEIRTRQKIETSQELNLKAWTSEQIHGAAFESFAAIWKGREALGSQSRKSFPQAFNPNSYPEEIRGTLRDSLSYLFADFLTDTGTWTPEQSNESFEIPLALLLEGYKLSPEDLADPKVHPLKKVSHVLTDLENWHESRGKREAALEARLDLVDKLHASRSLEQDRREIRDHLSVYLSKRSALPWYSMGMAHLATIIQQEFAHDSKLRARSVAMAGAEAHPSSPGAAWCRDLVKAIDQPAFSLEAMLVDAQERRSMRVTYRNLKKLYFRSYSYDLKTFLARAKDYNFRPQHEELKNLLSKKASYEWSKELVPTRDYRDHKAYVVPPKHKPGFYIVAASVREDFGEEKNQIQGVQMIFGNMILSHRIFSKGNEIEVQTLKGDSGEAFAGSSVLLYKANYQRGHFIVSRGQTDKEGIAKLQLPEKKSSNHYESAYFLMAENGKDISVSSQPFYDNRYPQSSGKASAFIYTDRSVYRPMQKIQWKIVAYRGNTEKGRFEVAPALQQTVQLRDANGENVESQQVTTDSFGAAAGEFIVPNGRLLGQWQIVVGSATVSVKVEEYKRPTFEVKFLESKAAYRLNKDAHLEAEAKYYFGLPLAEGKFRYSVRRRLQFPWWCFWGGFFGGGHQAGDQMVANGTGNLGKDGKIKLKFFPKADERLSEQFKDLRYHYQINLEVTDSGGETRTATKSLPLSFVAVNGSIGLDKEFFDTKTAGALTFSRSSLEGQPLGGKGTWKLTQLKQPEKTLALSELGLPRFLQTAVKDEFRTPDDNLLPRWNRDYNPEILLRDWEDAETLISQEIVIDDKGSKIVKLPKLEPGVYRARYETQDAFGAKFETQKEFVVSAEKTSVNLPALLALGVTSARVGETVDVFVNSGFSGQKMRLEVHRGGKVIDVRHLIAGKSPSLIKFPIQNRDRGGFGLFLRFIRDHQEMVLSRNISVPWDDKELNVSFATFRDKVRPGEKEKWTLQVEGLYGKKLGAGSAQILSYMYDRSLDIFAPHSPPSPLSLYPVTSWITYPTTELGLAPPAYFRSSGWYRSSEFSNFSRDYMTWHSNYGIGGPGARGGGGVALGRGAMMEAESDMVMADSVDQLSPRRSVAPMMAKAKAQLSDSRSDKDDGGGLESPKEENRQYSADSKGATVGSGSEAAPLRSNFSESAFWLPRLLLGEGGRVDFEFTVPDSVTSWALWAHAVTKDLRSGSVRKESQSIKEIMVRPYLPRFLREGDLAEIKVVINNAADSSLNGKLEFDLIDLESQKSVVGEFGLQGGTDAQRKFSIAKSGSGDFAFKIRAPARLGGVAVKVTAEAGKFSDGEIRPLPLLPGRFHLAQSRFVALKGKDQREMNFSDLASNKDSSLINEKMIVTLDAQLFYSVLTALPYLVNYPYECTEQLLNRFVSAGIVSSVFKKFPAIEKMAREFSKKKARFESISEPDPNRIMALEETPWLMALRGGKETESELSNVLDSRIAKKTREESLEKLEKAQTYLGAFPWFAGGPPNPYMTLYILYGFSKALEFGVDVPKTMVVRAWSYLHRHYIDEIVKEMRKTNCCLEFVTFLNYVLSNYRDTSWTGNVFTEAERKEMLDFSFKNWKLHSPYLKGYLALTLLRSTRGADAKLVWDSVMDSAKSSKDEGTHWAAEDRSWLWYNDTIETHAFALRTGSELGTPADKLDGLVQWIFLNKKLNHWKSTRATAEVIYSLTHYLKKMGKLGAKENAKVLWGGQEHRFEFSPDSYTGKKNQILIEGSKLGPQFAKVKVEKSTVGHLFASGTWHFSTEKLPPSAQGDFLNVKRNYFKRVTAEKETKLIPLAPGTPLKVGDEVEVHLSISSKHPMEYVHLRDPRVAGFEPVSQRSQHKREFGIHWYEEVRDSGNNFFFERLPQGEYNFRYRLYVSNAGRYKAFPATLQAVYAPDFAAYSSGQLIDVQ